MRRTAWGLPVYFPLFLVWAATMSSLNAQQAPPIATRNQSVKTLAAEVDRLLAKRLAEEGIEPAPAASDAEYLRRVYLDLTGVLPRLHDNEGTGIRDYLENESPDKREQLISRLLEKPTHSTHFSNRWTDLLLPGDSNLRQFGGGQGFQSWLREQFSKNVPYDKFVGDILLASGNLGQTGPSLFYLALERKPEELASATSRIFLGVQIGCAQCHDHPFDHWKRDDFWGFAAFFARIAPSTENRNTQFMLVEAASGELTIPGGKDVVVPKFLAGVASPDAEEAISRRMRLASWMTARENAYFARATVNRVWSLLFGRGLVEPVDDMGPHNPPSHPELLDLLAEDFVTHGYDLRRMIQALCLTEAYGRASHGSTAAEDRPELFAQMAVKSLSAEQIYDSLLTAAGRDPAAAIGFQAAAGFAGANNREQFLARFRAPAQNATEFQAGIPQALTLMNGPLIAELTDPGTSPLLSSLSAPFFSDEQRLEILFLSTLARFPREEERGRFMSHVVHAADDGQREQALSDVLWALLNTAEFVLNH